VIQQHAAATPFQTQVDASKAQRLLNRVVPVRWRKERQESAAAGA
jgi:hypothetical protein